MTMLFFYFIVAVFALNLNLSPKHNFKWKTPKTFSMYCFCYSSFWKIRLGLWERKTLLRSHLSQHNQTHNEHDNENWKSQRSCAFYLYTHLIHKTKLKFLQLFFFCVVEKFFLSQWRWGWGLPFILSTKKGITL